MKLATYETGSNERIGAVSTDGKYLVGLAAASGNPRPLSLTDRYPSASRCTAIHVA